jgi:hypothetical protein
MKHYTLKNLLTGDVVKDVTVEQAHAIADLVDLKLESTCTADVWVLEPIEKEEIHE